MLLHCNCCADLGKQAWQHLELHSNNLSPCDSCSTTFTLHVTECCLTDSSVLCAPVQQFADKVVENINVEDDYVWVHDYHLLALPSLLRKVRSHPAQRSRAFAARTWGIQQKGCKPGPAIKN